MQRLKNGRLNIPRGSYVIRGATANLADDDQKEWLVLMTGRVLSGYALADFLVDGGLDGALVQHRRSGVVYAVRGERLMKINGGEDE